jgi:hypothetical protein
MYMHEAYLHCLGGGLTVLFHRDVNRFLFVTFYVHGREFGTYRPAQRGLEARVSYADPL